MEGREDEVTTRKKQLLGVVGALMGGVGAWFAPRAAALPDTPDGGGAAAVRSATVGGPPLDVAAAAIHAETATFALG